MDYSKLKAGLDNCTNPVYLFDDDPDGVLAFTILYQYKQEGRGMILKTSPHITTDFVERIQAYNPDALFILDIANVDQEFIDRMKIPIFWVDHHEPAEVDKVTYINPKKEGKNICTTQLCYNAVGGKDWIMAAGNVADWILPDKSFSTAHPELLPPGINTPPDALFNTLLGEVVERVSFILKGGHKDAMKHVKILTRIETAEELLNTTTPQAKFLDKRYKKVKTVYDKHWSALKETEQHDKLLVFTYSENKLSFSSDLSNRALYEYKKVIIVGREKTDQIVCSIRSPEQPVLPILKRAINELGVIGGGHDKAVGCSLSRNDFPRFLEIFEEELA